MAADDNVLGGYLRARRAQVTPDQAGLPPGGTRRVAGLRRSEVAFLAGISVEYYLRLEQGRDRRPSPQVLEALARVLRLDPAGARYLVSLAEVSTKSSGRRRPVESVPEGTRRLLSALRLPAFVEGRFFDVLAANPLAAALSPRMAAGNNRLLAMFLDPEEQALYPDWEDTTARLVAGFRRSIGPNTNDSRAVELVGELSIGSSRFRELWAKHDVYPNQNWPVTIEHPLVGTMTLNREKLLVGDVGQSLVLSVHHADMGTVNADKLTLLSTLAENPADPPQHVQDREPRTASPIRSTPTPDT